MDSKVANQYKLQQWAEVIQECYSGVDKMQKKQFEASTSEKLCVGHRYSLRCRSQCNNL